MLVFIRLEYDDEFGVRFSEIWGISLSLLAWRYSGIACLTNKKNCAWREKKLEIAGMGFDLQVTRVKEILVEFREL